jgi:DNA polymerase-3 subunit delta
MPPATASHTQKAPIHVLCGDGEPALKKAAAEWAAKLAPADALNSEIIDGMAESVDDAVRSIGKVTEAILTLPFFGGGKLVWWKNVNFFDDSSHGRYESVKTALEGFIPTLDRVDGESVTLLITTPAIHKGRAFGKALLKRAAAKYFELPDLNKINEGEIIHRIAQRMREVGLRPGDGAAERFYEATGTDTALWGPELEKLACYLGGEAAELTRDDVSRVASGTRDIVIWDFCRAVLESKIRPALRLLESLLAQDESEHGILAILAGQVRYAALGAALREAGLLASGPFGKVAAEAEPYLPRKKDGTPISTYALAQAAQGSRQRPARFWFQAIGALHRAQRDILGGIGDKRGTLERVVTEIAG